MRIRKLYILAAAAVLAGTAGAASCARYNEESAAGEVITPEAAANTVVLHVNNLSNQPLELRSSLGGIQQFVGSVQSHDSTSLLLDPSLFPTGTLYVIGIPADLNGRAVIGPLAATKGDRIVMTVQPALEMSNAVVIR